MEETLELDHEKSLAAPIIFVVVLAFQFLTKFINHKKKRGAMSEADRQLRAEIKQLLKDANSLSQPSTFAQAAILRRMATAKEKKLAKNQESHSNSSLYTSYGQALSISKVLTYLVLILWFWRIPVATISSQLVQPFGKILSWRAGGPLKDNVMVGIIPWLILSTRVSKYFFRKVFK